MTRLGAKEHGARTREAKLPALPRFCVVSLNPAIDAEWQVDKILWEEKNVVHSQRRWAGGKGANVARWLRFLGADCELLIPLGGVAGRELQEYLDREELRSTVIPVRQETRVNVVITEASGCQMRFNQPGAALRPAEWRSVTEHVNRAAKSRAALVLSGSLPPKSNVSRYARFTQLANRHGAAVFLDCDGTTLVEAVKARPFLIKPNRHELAGWAGRSLKSLAQVRAAAGEMSTVSGGWVLVSLGADGAMLVNVNQGFAAHAPVPAVNVMNTLGAGDATLAAVAHLALSTDDPCNWLRGAVAAGAAATQARPGEMVPRRRYEALRAEVRVKVLRAG